MADKRSVELDIIGQNKVTKATNSAARDFQNLSGKVQGLNTRFATAARVGLKTAGALAAIAANAPAVAAGALAAGAGLAAAAKSAASFAAGIAPAAASLPAVAAGALLVKKTISSTGPAMAKAFSPVTKAFKAGQGEVDRLATRGLPSLARQFSKVNFPAIHGAMKAIATATNGVVVQVGRWVNSAEGQSAIRDITTATATAVQRLAPHISALAISFGKLVARAGSGAFPRLATLFSAAADAARRFIDSISAADIDRAWQRVDGLVQAVQKIPGVLAAAYGKLQEGVAWWRANEDAINRVRTILGIVAIVVGIATGGWMIALGGALALIETHWTQVSGAVSGAVSWFRQATAAGGSLRPAIDAVKGAVSDLSSWFSDRLLPALQRAATAIMPAVRDAVSSVTKTLRDNRDAVDKAKGILTALGVVLTEAVIPALTLAGQVLLPILAAQFRSVVTTINLVVLPAFRVMASLFLDQVGLIVHGASAMFGWVPGIGPKLKEAASKFDKFRDQVNGALRGVKDRDVKVTAHFKAVGDVALVVGSSKASGSTKLQARASGGPVAARRPYLVGERGPELVVPSSPGRVMSARQTRSALAGGGNTTLVVNVHAPVVRSDRAMRDLVVSALTEVSRRGTRLPALKFAPGPG